MKTQILCLFSVLLLSLGGCQRQEALTGREAREALEELETDSQSQALTGSTVEISTHFTIGDAVEKAAGDLRGFVLSQIPCAHTTLAASTLTIEYGASGSCLFNGQAFSGTHTVSIARNGATEVVVDHTWSALSNGKVQVDGTATVTWTSSPDDPSRHVEHDLVWTRLSSGRTGEGKGDRTQRPLSGGLVEGFSEDGHRSWDGKSGHWDLEIDQLEMRWTDPVPQAGTLTLDTPFDKTIAVDFARTDATTIHVNLQGPRRSFGFDVKSTP